MAYDERLAARVREALRGVRQVETKRMFGGLTFMVRGKMCVSVGPARIMCRIDPAGHDAAVRRPGARTVKMKGRAYRGFVHVSAAAVATKRALDSWVKLALAYNRRARATRVKTRRSSSRTRR